MFVMRVDDDMDSGLDQKKQGNACVKPLLGRAPDATMRAYSVRSASV